VVENIKVKYLIVGGGVAGTTAAETLRQNDTEGSIAIVSDEPYPFYSRIMLSKPNFFLGKIPFETIFLKKENWYKEKNINFIGGVSANNLDPQKKIISLSDGRTIEYEKLLLAIGGCACRWQINGSDKKGVYYLRTLDEAKEIINALKAAQKAICIGGGFVSFETCELLRMRNIDTTLLVTEPYYWANLLDEESGLMIEDALQKGGVKIFKNETTEEVLGDEKVSGLRTKTDKKFEADMIIVGIGIMCPMNIFQKNGLAVGRGILANEYLETNLPDIWTAGDSAEFKDLILNEQIMLGNWVNAQAQGRIAALNMLGKKQPFRMVSFYTTTAFGLNIAFVGDVKVSGGVSIIKRGSREGGSFGRILIKDGEIIGATLMNRTNEMVPISKLIENNFKIFRHENELANINFDLKRLIKN
jgi:NAD(P)H-nitrite reductase large subunit